MKIISGKTLFENIESEELIKSEAEKVLKRAQAIGVYPTPVGQIIQSAGIEEADDVEAFKETFLKGASGIFKKNFSVMWNKIRGMADIKQNAIYSAPDSSPRQNWAKLHELGHQVLKWQNVQLRHVDDSKSLRSDCEDLFDREANVFASEVLFQGKKFHQFANSYRPTFENIFSISNMHGASKHSTARKFTELCDEPIVLLSYYPSSFSLDEEGKPVFTLGRAYSYSQKFQTKFEDLLIPERLESIHPWYSAVKSSLVESGSVQLASRDGQTHKFLWEAWWNSYSLLVMARKAPRFRVVRSLLEGP